MPCLPKEVNLLNIRPQLHRRLPDVSFYIYFIASGMDCWKPLICLIILTLIYLQLIYMFSFRQVEYMNNVIMSEIKSFPHTGSHFLISPVR